MMQLPHLPHLHSYKALKVSIRDAYDYCLVLPVKNGTFSEKRGQGYMKKLSDLGFEYYIFKVDGKAPQKQCYQCVKPKDKDKASSFTDTFLSFFRKPMKDDTCFIYILIRAKQEKLFEIANRIQILIQLQESKIQEELAKDRRDQLQIAPINIQHDPEMTPLRPFEFIYAPYSITNNTNNIEHLYYKGESRENAKDPFREIIRLKLTAILLESRPRSINSDGSHAMSQNLKIHRYLKEKWILGCFVMHNLAEAFILERKWRRYPFTPQPLDDIKEYFGEKLGLYYAFVGHYTLYLVYPSLLAIPFQILVFLSGNYTAGYIPFFSGFLAVWSIMMLQFWKQKQRYYAMRWGMIGFEDNELERPGKNAAVIVMLSVRRRAGFDVGRALGVST